MQDKKWGKLPWQRLVFVAAILTCTVMAVIPGSIDPTGFVNDKVKHVIVFFVLALMLDYLAFPTARFTWYKPLGLLAFGVLLEVLQDTLGFRKGSNQDLLDILSNLAGITGYFVVAAVVKRIYRVKLANGGAVV
ncbi:MULTISPECIES: hypothetical protein [Gammaproteobacteria]|uniref:hypothetical protein n=1 Tax=Gammaproteobacteria TaxID=1236 RepID=UPI001ADA382C|nr:MULTISPECIES: hypothetical protein [Gammaproteobacteria]MBO9483131.1 hypothetical protein [Salinisphaera sp. G21_0]MBO9497083.1 hypothetical protein [Thalassotalea sp. G20_0]